MITGYERTGVTCRPDQLADVEGREQRLQSLSNEACGRSHASRCQQHQHRPHSADAYVILCRILLDICLIPLALVMPSYVLIIDNCINKYIYYRVIFSFSIDFSITRGFLRLFTYSSINTCIILHRTVAKHKYM